MLGRAKEAPTLSPEYKYTCHLGVVSGSPAKWRVTDAIIWNFNNEFCTNICLNIGSGLYGI